MRRITFGAPADGGLRILAIGAHSDDIEIGAGGTILRLAAEGRIAQITWLVLSADGPRRAEALTAAAAFLEGVASPDVRVASFRDGFFPGEFTAIKERFEELKSGVAPDLILTHRHDDAHQDHRLVAQLTWNTFRDHPILEYEIAKYDADLGQSNVYVALDEAACSRKVELLMASFPSQASRTWFDAEVFRGLLRLRGIEAGGTTRYAEAFNARKLVL